MEDDIILKAIEEYVVETINKDIEQAVSQFRRTLVARRDRYLADVMSGIRVMHETNPEKMYVDYRIMFINKYEVEAKNADR